MFDINVIVRIRLETYRVAFRSVWIALVLCESVIKNALLKSMRDED